LVTVRLNRAKRRLRPRGSRIGRQGRLWHSSRWGPGCPKPAVSKLSPHPAARLSDNSVHCWRTSPLAHAFFRTWSCGRESGCAEDRAVLGVDSGTSASEARHATGAPGAARRLRSASQDSTPHDHTSVRTERPQVSAALHRARLASSTAMWRARPKSWWPTPIKGQGCSTKRASR